MRGRRSSGIWSLILLMVAGFGLITLNLKKEKAITSLESFALAVLSPVHGFITGTTQQVENAWEGYLDLVQVKRENTKLREEVRKLREMANAGVELQQQNRRLLQLLDFKEKTQFDLVLAQVIGVDSSNWSRAIFINRGSRDGIRKDLPVVTHEGVVGRVIEATPDAAKVLLITDPRSAVDALIQRTRDTGIVVGDDARHARMKYLPLESNLKTGDLVVSSGLGGIFPKGLVVGRVTGVTKQKFGLFQEAEISPSANLSRLEEVFVIAKGS